MARSLSLYLAWLFASIGILASLYFSHISHFEPCYICWYQRICLFPLGIILGIAAYKSFLNITIYILPQVIIGFLFSVYQIAIQEFPNLNGMSLCGKESNCINKYDLGLGFITIPMLSAILFLVVGSLLLFSWKYKSQKKDDHF
ncbi:MAG: disulfide bond formation protein B [Chlamydiales bacterium]